MEVNVRKVDVTVRTVSLTKALLKQVREFKSVPLEPFRTKLDEHQRWTFNAEYTVGWFRGTVLGYEYEDCVLLAKDGDLYISRVVRSNLRQVLPEGCKQIYV
jgi:hypothetical protein